MTHRWTEWENPNLQPYSLCFAAIIPTSNFGTEKSGSRMLLQMGTSQHLQKIPSGEEPGHHKASMSPWDMSKRKMVRSLMVMQPPISANVHALSGFILQQPRRLQPNGVKLGSNTMIRIACRCIDAFQYSGFVNQIGR